MCERNKPGYGKPAIAINGQTMETLLVEMIEAPRPGISPRAHMDLALSVIDQQFDQLEARYGEHHDDDQKHQRALFGERLAAHYRPGLLMHYAMFPRIPSVRIVVYRHTRPYNRAGSITA